MKVVAYSIKPFEKEFLAKANRKKHDITLISNPLSIDTAVYAAGKDAVVVFTNDDVSEPVIEKLASLGVRFIATRSAGTDHIDKAAAAKYDIRIAKVQSYSPQAKAEHVIALAFTLNRHVVKASEHTHHFDFRNDGLMGFNFSGKTVGIIGLGKNGLAVAKLFSGLGCTVLGYDMHFPENTDNIVKTTLANLLANADIISLHLPLTPFTKHLINKDTLSQMKDGVMLINTSRGAIIDTLDLLDALKTGKVGYLGLDVYEYEKGLFFEDHEDDLVKDHLLQRLMQYPNVVVTPHQAYLTKESLQEIADETIKNLDLWQQDKCAGDNCACDKDCAIHAEKHKNHS
jgi:D-lactate dehydrogenase